MATTISISGLVKTFGPTRALDGLDLEVRTGEVHGFLGPNGAGKTTTLRVLLGLLRADAGTARLLDGDIRAYDVLTGLSAIAAAFLVPDATVLVDGFVAATWDVGTKRDLTITPLRRLTKFSKLELDKEREDDKSNGDHHKHAKHMRDGVVHQTYTRRTPGGPLLGPYYQQLLTLTPTPGDFPLRRHDEY